MKMKRNLLVVFIFLTIIRITEAQQNWASVPCSKVSALTQFNRMWVDSVHNEIILSSIDGYSICNTHYRGLVAYNGIAFHDLDYGLSTHRIGPSAGGDYLLGLITYGNKTLFGGSFLTVGKDTIKAKSLALWNGTKWDTFPHHVFNNNMNAYNGGTIFGFLKHSNKLWMYGSFDTIGSVISKNIVTFDGNTFSPVPAIPVNNPSYISEAIVYKNKLVVGGNFYDSPSFNFYRLAQFDGTTWSQVGGGVRGSLSAIQSMAIYNDTLYIGGSFPKSAGNAGNYLMKWDGNQLTDAGLSNVFCGYGAVWRLLPYRNRLYAFGGINCATGKKAFGVAYYENGKWTVPQDSIEGTGVFDAVVYNDAIYIGGSFQSINGDTSIQKFAKLLCPDFDASTGCLSGLKDNYINRLNLTVFPNPANNKLNIETDYSIKIERITLTNALGQVVVRALNPENKLTLDISYLPSGIYFLRAENKQGQSAFKVIKE